MLTRRMRNVMVTPCARGQKASILPLTGPPCRPPRRRPKQHKRKCRHARRAHAVLSSDKPKYTSKHEPLPAAQAAQINIKRKAAMPQSACRSIERKPKYASKHEPLLAAQAPQMNILIIMTNQAAPNTRNNHSYPPSVYNALDPMRHLGQFPMQREGARWHCAARREIAERSEEAPGA